jgi:hypothetical protein
MLAPATQVALEPKELTAWPTVFALIVEAMLIVLPLPPGEVITLEELFVILPANNATMPVTPTTKVVVFMLAHLTFPTVMMMEPVHDVPMILHVLPVMDPLEREERIPNVPMEFVLIHTLA